MIESILLLCNFTEKNDIAVQKVAKLVAKNVIVCDYNKCNTAITVIFKGEVEAVTINENDCLYITKE